MFVESGDDEQIIARVAALDIGKAEIVCCIRLPAADGGRRVQEVSTHSTMVTSLCELANRLVGLGVERVVMEATSDYWRPPFYLFEAHGRGPHGGEEPGREAARGCLHQTVGRGLRHLRRLRPGDAGRVDRRGT